MPDEWSLDELRVIRAHLDELRGIAWVGETVGAGTRVVVFGGREHWLHARCVVWLNEDEPVEAGGTVLPRDIIERALRLHARDGLGRRPLAVAVPGLTEWTAGQVLRWYRKGKPDGLWFDERDRLQVGAKLAPTHAGVRLPRL